MFNGIKRTVGEFTTIEQFQLTEAWLFEQYEYTVKESDKVLYSELIKSFENFCVSFGENRFKKCTNAHFIREFLFV